MAKKKLTRKQAKEITIEVWEYLRDHPEIIFKSSLPSEMFNRIRYLINECPLCELYHNEDCKNCPLNKAKNYYGCVNNDISDDLYNLWGQSDPDDNELREKSASGIVELVKKWRV